MRPGAHPVFPCRGASTHAVPWADNLMHLFQIICYPATSLTPLWPPPHYSSERPTQPAAGPLYLLSPGVLSPRYAQGLRPHVIQICTQVSLLQEGLPACPTYNGHTVTLCPCPAFCSSRHICFLCTSCLSSLLEREAGRAGLLLVRSVFQCRCPVAPLEKQLSNE